MKKIFFIIILANTFLNCQSKSETAFSSEALTEELISVDGEKFKFDEVLQENNGNYIFINVWASWCKDCIVSLSDLKELQRKNSNVKFLYLSLDKSIKKWKEGIKKYGIEGDHFFLPNKKKGPLGKFLTIDWIPRYLIVNPEGKITLFKAIETNDENLLNLLK